MKKTANKYVWCPLHQQNKPIGNCPKCHQFPCRELKKKDLAIITESHPLNLVLRELKKNREKNMFFLEQADGKLSQYKGTLEALSDKQAAATIAAHEIAICYEQRLTWLPEGKTPPRVTSSGKAVSVIEYRDGSLKIEEVDPGVPDEDIARIYPVKKKYLRAYVPVKVALDKAEKKTSSPGKARKPAARGPEK